MKLLVTARDAGAAFNIIEIVKQGYLDKDIQLSIYTQKPAIHYFNDAGIEVRAVDLPVAKSLHGQEAENLIQLSKRILDEVNPDVILAGLSTPIDAGLDEAIIYSSKGEIPSFVMQDFWGEVNQLFGVQADYYLALDDDAVRLTKKLHQANAIAIGSPRHAIYQDIDILARRSLLRKELAIEDGQTIGFFGQALHHIPGYHITIKHWAETIQKVGKNCSILYRKHPRESVSQAQETIDLLNSMNLNFRILSHEKVVDSLLSCDIVCSLFSNCSYDASYLNYFCSQPCVVPMVLFFDPGIIQYFTNTIKTNELPYLKKGLAIGVDRADMLPEKMAYALSERAKINVWNACKNLKNPSIAAVQAINVMKTFSRSLGKICNE